MLRSIIFDFNGILVDDEPIHMELFQKVLGEEGMTLTEKDYYARYLGLDDRGAFKAAYRDHGRKIDTGTTAGKSTKRCSPSWCGARPATTGRPSASVWSFFPA
ncbi:MAG: HAD family phosphatase [Deltaproteobacteria bacterium]|nr:HAD family phosphatase [Deltaproteobacteria bacterium]